MLKRRRGRRRRRRLNRPRVCLLLVVILCIAAAVYVHLIGSILSIPIESTAQKGNTPNHLRTNPLSFQSKSNPLPKFVENPKVNYNVHAFYYPWYCNPQVDGEYMHWNHPLLPHWDPQIAKHYPSGRHSPPDDIGASFYPQLGPYSSADPIVIKTHFEWFVHAGIGVAVVSWLPPHQHDDNGPPIAERLPQLLDLACEYGIKIALHMEPYDDRTPESFSQDVQQLLRDHGDHPALYKLPRRVGSTGGSAAALLTKDNKQQPLLPVLYVYDQYRIAWEDWARIFQNNEDFPALTLALIVEQKHWNDYVLDAGFDGGYTYFASNTFTYGSNPKHWKHLQSKAQEQHKLFLPSVGPGYDDTRVRPWNEANTHPRGGGAADGDYYNLEWRAAVDAGVSMVSITSFNEWHEGTQIEPAIPKTIIPNNSIMNTIENKGGSTSYTYQDYGAGGPMAYLDLTRIWVDRFQQQQKFKRGHT